MHPLEAYLTCLRDIRATGAGVPETSYYGALEALFNEVGRTLKPRVCCVLALRNRGAGLPDGGLFTADQFNKKSDAEPVQGQKPARGAIEVKPTLDDAWLTAEKKQVTGYWEEYGQVLVTNYRDFLLIGREKGEPVVLESYRLASSEADFWHKAQHPRATTRIQGDLFADFLKRVLLHPSPIADPETVAWFLASYAREARARIAGKDIAGLAALRTGLEEALGMKFEGDEGERFFRATLVQTLFYGVFSSWVLWARNLGFRTADRFNWHAAAWSLHVPMIAGLFQQIATPQKLKPLGLDEVLDRAQRVLNRVDRAAFFDKFEEEHAVQYFYEPFLKAYDPDLRKKLGVWYTPPEIVQYQVARVDTVLREELDIADGLADENVYVLDPCCGTGAYLVEVLRKIHETLERKGGHALVAQQLKKAAMERVFGFEILPAPFVVSHLQLGLLLRRLDAPLSEKKNERVGVYLTNALTGWEPPTGPKQHLMYPEMEAERDAADEVKREKPILVILGNPPYNAFAGTSPEEEQGLVDAYKVGLNIPVKDGGWGIKKFNLDDLYVRFFRIAERRILKSGKGIVCYISNRSWVSEPSFVVLRESLLKSFDKFWVENLHGNRKISEYAPNGRTSQTVFAIPGLSPGIRQGVVTSLWVKTGKGSSNAATVKFRDDIDAAGAVDRRQQLLASLKLKRLDRKYNAAKPDKTNRYSFRPAAVSRQYLAWPAVPELAARDPYNGPIERRGNSLIVFPEQRGRLLAHLRQYLDPAVSDESIRLLVPAFMTSSGEFDAKKARRLLLASACVEDARVKRYPFKPFDVRLAYLDPYIAPLFSRPSPELLAQSEVQGNAFFITRDTSDKSPEGPPFHFSRLVCDYDFISGHARHFPVRICHVPNGNGRRNNRGQRALVSESQAAYTAANLSAAATSYLRSLGVAKPESSGETATVIWMHALAVGYSPAYLSENADGIRQDWPRIPVPDTKKALLASAKLGEEVAALLDTEKPVSRVTSGATRPELRALGVVSRVGGGNLNPDAGELDLAAGWGYAGKAGVTMPGRGRLVERAYTDAERTTIQKGAKALGLAADATWKLLGKKTLDVYLNDTAYWTNVPLGIWNYYIGGYQVVKKWLSYREKALLGRPMRMDEVLCVTEMVRRIAAIILLQPRLDDSYRAVTTATYRWPRAEER